MWVLTVSNAVESQQQLGAAIMLQHVHTDMRIVWQTCSSISKAPMSLLAWVTCSSSRPSSDCANAKRSSANCMSMRCSSSIFLRRSATFCCSTPQTSQTTQFHVISQLLAYTETIDDRQGNDHMASSKHGPAALLTRREACHDSHVFWGRFHFMLACMAAELYKHTS